jgi:hypothetical protein
MDTDGASAAGTCQGDVSARPEIHRTWSFLRLHTFAWLRLAGFGASRIWPCWLLEAQGDQRIDARGATGWDVASQEGDGHQ